MPELPGLAYNRGLSDFHAKHTSVSNFVWELPFPSQGNGLSGRFSAVGRRRAC